MSRYRYRAVDDQGRRVRGAVEALHREEVHNLLRQRGLHPVSIEPLRTRTWRTPCASLKHEALWLRELSTLISSGLSVDEALDALIAASQGQGTVWLAVQHKVREGHPLSVALESKGFSGVVCAGVRASEASGNLGAVLERLADHLEERVHTRRHLVQAFAYPCVMMVIAWVILVLLMVYVVPQMAEVFDDMEVPLPAVTQHVLWWAHSIQEKGLWWCLVSAFVCAGLLRQYRYVPSWRYGMQRMVLSCPVIGRSIMHWQLGMWCHTVAMLMSSGVSVLEALRCATDALSYEPIASPLRRVMHDVKGGRTLVHALRATGLWDPVALRMMASGEGRGQLPSMLGKIAIRNDAKVQATWSLVLRFLEPGLVLVMGGMVCVMVLAVLWPVLDMNTLLTL